MSIRNPVLGSGSTESGLVLIGEAPGRTEAATGVPFAGPAGKILDATLKEVGINREDTYVTNAVLCRPVDDQGRDAPPSPSAIAACRPRLVEEVRRATPRMVVTLGNSAAQASLAGVTRGKISDLVGTTHWVQDFEAYVAPTFHPAAVLRGSIGLFDDILSVFKRTSAILKGRLEPPSAARPIEYDHVWVGEPAFAVERLSTLAKDAVDGPLAIDLETDSFRFLEDKILLVAISSQQRNVVFEAGALATGLANQLFVAMLTAPDIQWVLHNLAFDFQFLQYHYGAVPTNVIDTMTMALGVNERGQSVGLKHLAREWFSAQAYEDKVDEIMRRKSARMSDVPWPLLVEYAAHDTHYTVRLPAVLGPIIREEDTERLVDTILLPAQKLFAQVEARGVLIDVDYARGLEKQWLPLIEASIADLQAFARDAGFNAYDFVAKPKTGADLNPRSSVQMNHLIYDVLGFSQVQGLGRTTNEQFMEAYSGEPVVQKLQKFRELDKLLATYVYGILDDVWIDGRVHPDFKIFGTVTGRLAVGNPPMQTIPHYGTNAELARLIRRMFVATPGYVFFEYDYSQLELRMAWHYSRDEALGEALMSGDFHTRTAARILGKPESAITKADRFISKFVTFGVMYGRQAPSLARGELNCSIPEAVAYIRAFWAAYPRYKKWWDSVRRFVREEGYVRSSVGRKRRWPLITPDNVEDILNQAVNMPIQSLASDLCLMSAIDIDAELRAKGWGYVLFLVHDSIAMEIKEGYEREAHELVMRRMTTPQFETCAHFDVEGSWGPNWGDTIVVKEDVAA